MPNWMECEVQITGPADEAARFRAAHITKDEDGQEQLNFETVVAMPPELNGTDPNLSDDYVWALGGELDGSRRPWVLRHLSHTPLDKDWVRNLGITSRQGLLQWATENEPDRLALAKHAMEIESTTGYRHWRDWQWDNWGCEKGCYAFKWLCDDRTAFYMMTTWMAPTPIFKKLVDLFPTLTFVCHFVEENMEVDYNETYAA